MAESETKIYLGGATLAKPITFTDAGLHCILVPHHNLKQFLGIFSLILVPKLCYGHLQRVTGE